MIVTLLTDFGLQDEYVGVMKGVILQINPTVHLVDLCHQIPPGDIPQAARLLSWAWAFFPTGTLHVVVVDPTVGARRRILLAEHGGHRFLVPDNGVLSVVLAGARRPRLYSVSNRRYFLPRLSRTFHGRDIFSPVAGHLSLGLPVSRLGRRVSSFTRLPLSKAVRRSDGSWSGQVIHLDRFGNALTNLAEADLRRSPGRGGWEVEVDGIRSIPAQRSYVEVPAGSPLAIFGSRGLLEIAVSRGSAAGMLGICIGDRVVARRSGR